MYITSWCTDEDGAPATGLSPVVYLWEITGTSAVLNGVAMTEHPSAPGWYYYNFTTYNYTKEYVGHVDAGASRPRGTRYKPITNANFVNDIDDKLTAEHGDGDWTNKFRRMQGE